MSPKPEGYEIEPLKVFDKKHENDLSEFEPIFPRREGDRPETTDWEPHQQVTQHGAEEIWDELYRRCFALPNVRDIESLISVPGARALWLDEAVEMGPKEAFIIEREFAHIHPKPDSSTHLHLPLEVAVFAISGGWAELHNVSWLGLAGAETVMLYAPRDEEELEIIWSLVEESYRFAIGEAPKFQVTPQKKAAA
jgi:phospholipase/carboxylesterase